MTVVERFLKYVSFDTRSDENSQTMPSTPKQKILGAALAEEMQALGLQGVSMDENGYVFGFLPATEGYEDRPVLGFLSHMDTSPDVSGENVKPQIVSYQGGDIPLKNGDVIALDAFPFLSNPIRIRLD